MIVVKENCNVQIIANHSDASYTWLLILYQLYYNIYDLDLVI